MKVPQGKTVDTLTWKYLEIKKRKIVPRNPPNPTTNNDLTIKLYLNNLFEW
jgi:hypothetical protein